MDFYDQYQGIGYYLINNDVMQIQFYIPATGYYSEWYDDVEDLEPDLHEYIENIL